MTCINNNGSVDGSAYVCPNGMADKTGASCPGAHCTEGDCCDGLPASAVVWEVPTDHLTLALLVR